MLRIGLRRVQFWTEQHGRDCGLRLDSSGDTSRIASKRYRAHVALKSIVAFCLSALLLALTGPALSASAPPAMIVPGQFNVSATGGFTYTIPIAVPPGTGGMVPALSLDYSSQSGDGLEGLGWTLSGLPSIGRCPRTIAQDTIHGGVNYSASDRFCMEGQRLVAVTRGTYGIDLMHYRTEIEGFSDIISHGSSGTGPAYFEVHTKAGQVMYFGWNEDTDNTSNNSRLTLSSANLTAQVPGRSRKSPIPRATF